MKKIPLAIVGRCREHIAAGQVLTCPDAVHELRKATKRLRACWHLVAKTSGKNLARTRRAELREASALLAESRDNTVLQEISRELASELDGKFSSPFGQLHSWVILHPPKLGAEGVDDKLNQVFVRELENWDDLPDPSEESLRRGIEKSQRLEFKRRRNALGQEDLEQWHEWRKSVKRLTYQLAAVYGEEDRRVVNWGELGSKLGRLNDLHQVALALEEAEVDEGAPERIQALCRALRASCSPPSESN